MSTVLGGSAAAGNQGDPDPNAGGNPGSGGGAAGGAAGGSGAAGSGATPSWRDKLPEDIRGHQLLQSINSEGDLAKGYIHAQGLVGKKGVIVPGEKATEEERSNFYKALGLPELEKFHVEQPAGANIPKERLEKLKGMFHKAGVLPQQAQQLMGEFFAEEKANTEAQVQQLKQFETEQLGKLKTDWGQGYDKQVAYANYVVNEIGGEEFSKYLSKTGLGNDVNLIKIFAKIGAALGGDKALAGQGGGNFGQTPEEIQGQIDEVMGNPKHAYFDRGHPGHDGAVKKMEALYKARYSSRAAG